MAATRTEIAIVGAGPAGAWAAYRLASAGARVALIDGSHPREKPCGGGLTGRAIHMVRPALDVERLPCVTVATAEFTYESRHVHVPLPRSGSVPSLVVTSRRDLDGALLAAAIGAGATHIPLRAVDVARDPSGWRIQTRTGAIICRWLLGADGPGSLVRRRVFRPFARADLSIASGCFVRTVSAPSLTIAFEHAPAGYLWSFPRADHLAVGACAQADESTSAALERAARTWICQEVGPSAPLERYAWPIPSLSESAIGKEVPAGRGWLLLGDAAGLVDPITREGIYFALRSGDLAADTLLADSDPSSGFALRIRDEIHPELRRAAGIKARFFRPPFIRLLLSALDRSKAIRAIMADLVAGRQTYDTLRRRLLSTLNVRLALELYRAW
jgi:geranylgeranyl reductase family protein